MGGNPVADNAESVYQKILLVVRQIPRGRVATYGQIAWIVGAASPRMAGYALGGLPPDTDIPWQRVVNGQGGISPRGDPLATERQRRRLWTKASDFCPTAASTCAASVGPAPIRVGWKRTGSQLCPGAPAAGGGGAAA